MKKMIIALMLICVQQHLYAAFIDTVRTDFYKAVESEQETDRLRNVIVKAYPDDGARPAVFDGYIGALDTLKGKFAYNPYNKFSYVSDGLSRINKAVRIDPQNLEIRFIRFSVLHHLPPLFGVESMREEDAAVICRIIADGKTAQYPPKLVTGVIEFMSLSGRLNDGQKKMISGANR